MNGILYNLIKHKRVNGSLFYCFEYFCFLKDRGIDIKFIIVDASSRALSDIKDSFISKYNFNHNYLDDIIATTKRSDLYKMNIKNLITLDTRSLDLNRYFIPYTKIFPYASHHDSKDLPYDFYGFYDYQLPWKYKTRLKLYKEIHKTYDKVDDKIFFSSLNIEFDEVKHLLPYSVDQIISKPKDKAIDNLFSKISKVVYYGSVVDVNNRLVVECDIHNIPFELYNPYPDSIQERMDTIKDGRAHELYLDDSDILIGDFIENTKC